MIELTDQNFAQEISSGLALVDFHAVWCGPCRMQKPILLDLEQEQVQGLKIVAVNADDCPNAVNTNLVKALPTLVLFKNGKEVERLVGVNSLSKLRDKILPYVDRGMSFDELVESF